MIKNHIKIALRVFRRHKGYSFIKVSGLAIGMAACILILLFIRYELSFDNFHENKDRVYRILSELDLTQGAEIVPLSALPLAPALKSDLSEVSKAARFSAGGRKLLRIGDKTFYEDVYYADADVFDIFSFPLLAGDSKTALIEPQSIVITEKIARKYFGNDNPVGKSISLEDTEDYRITGVLKEIPKNSHLQFEILASFSSLNNTERVKGNYWDRFSNDYTYALLQKAIKPEDISNRLASFIEKHIPAEDDRYVLHFQPLNEIHFSTSNYDIARRTEKEYLYAYGTIAFFILLIACINFMNLATARSSNRTKEVGIRKVVGARRIQLIRQFFTESVLTSFLSLIGATGLVFFVLPKFNQIIRGGVTFNLIHDPALVPGLLTITLFVGFLSGSYPAFVLSAFQPVKVLKKEWPKRNKNISFRTISTVVQFSTSIILIIATLVVYTQLHYMKTKDLGFDAQQVLAMPLRVNATEDKIEAFKRDILNHPFIINASASFGTPASGTGAGRTYIPEGFPKDEAVHLDTLFIDYDFIPTFGIHVISGRNFSREFATDAHHAFILNETAVNKFGWANPLGKRISQEDSDIEGRVIGVVKDFHYDSVQYKIAPMILALNRFQVGFLSLKIRYEEISPVLAFLENKWKEFAPEYPFEYFFVSEEFARYYSFERRLGNLFTICSLLALFISCMGIFGMASYTVEQRTKEIGIRKVLGASVRGIVGLLSKEFVKWLLIANALAWPIAYVTMNRWLQNFAYRTDLKLWMFFVSAILALCIALITVSYQSIKTAVANPIDSLRFE
ncbi:MAG: ABC transporter permease [Candidatus Aminicenantes bacterium]|nr:ABC transporter permease [Candidatus Aminicenantes bacterium]